MRKFLFILGLIFIIVVICVAAYSAEPVKYSKCYCSYDKCNCTMYYVKQRNVDPYYYQREFQRMRRYMRNNYQYRYYYQRYPGYRNPYSYRYYRYY